MEMEHTEATPTEYIPWRERHPYSKEPNFWTGYLIFRDGGKMDNVLVLEQAAHAILGEEEYMHRRTPLTPPPASDTGSDREIAGEDMNRERYL